MARTFVVRTPHMEGEDVEDFQQLLNRQFKQWGWDHRIGADGDYGVGTRSAAATVLYGLGFTQSLMARGITPELRDKIRHRRRTPRERVRWEVRRVWRRRQKDRYGSHVAPPLNKVLADSWGWVPGVHDGIDLICREDAPIYAMTDAQVIRADTGGWWGNAPSGDVSKGDGIIVLECRTDQGPFRKGLRIGYGHAEHPRVSEGQTVKAGQRIGRAGTAVVPHIHLMVNGRSDDRGVGDRDPRPFYRYAMKQR